MCAQVIDARVKQKTGTAAEFAGYTLLKGEMALVKTSASGPVWNFKVGPGNFDSLDWSLQNPGAAQKADTSTVFPAGVPGLYIPTEDGTYDGVSVDLSAGYVQLIWDGSTMTKVEFPINLSGYTTVQEAVRRVDLTVSGSGSENEFDPTSLGPSDRLLNCAGNLQNRSQNDAVVGIVDNIEPDTDYYIQGRSVRNTLRFYDINDNPLGTGWDGGDFCGGPVNGVYRSPVNAYRVRFVISWGDNGGPASNVMFFKGTEAKPEFEPYVPVLVTKVTGRPLAADSVKDADGEYRSVTGAIENSKPGTFLIEQGGDQLFDRNTMVRYGYSLSSGGNNITSATSSMSTDIPVDPSKETLTISGRNPFRFPLVFMTEDFINIPSDFGPDYNSGPANGTYPIPPNAAWVKFAISFQGTGDGSENDIMLNYGDEEIPWEEYRPTGVKYIRMGGVNYPLLGEGGSAPAPSSFTNQGVRYQNDELVIISPYSNTHNLKMVFMVSLFNETFLPNSSGKITRDNDSITPADFDKEIEINMMRWGGTDGISPYTLGTSPLFVGGNHGQPEPPPYEHKTSTCLDWKVWADGKLMQDGDIVDAAVVTVRVENEVYNGPALIAEPSTEIVDFHEIHTHRVVGGQLMTNVRLVAARNISFRTIYGLQMQVAVELNRVYFPRSLYVDVDNRNVNPNDANGRPYGEAQDYPDFEKFIVAPTTIADCTAVWIDQNVGLGDKSALAPTAPVARGKQLKLYHNLLNVSTPLLTGESLEYAGGVNVFKNLVPSATNTFAYLQWEEGEVGGTFSQYLILDFAGTTGGRSINVNFPELSGKTLTLVDSDPTVNVPGSLSVPFAVTNTGHGGAKFLVI